MNERTVLDQTNLRLAWPLLGAALFWIYLGALIAWLGSASLPLVAGTVVLAVAIYQYTARTDVDLGYVFVGAAGLTAFALVHQLAGDAPAAVFGTVVSGSLFCLPIAALAKKRVAPQVPGWLANLVAGLCLGVIATVLAAREHPAEGPTLSLITGVGIPTFAALTAVAFWTLPSHVSLILGRALVRTVYRIRFEGVEQVPQHQGFLACANHVSYIDWLLMGVAFERPYRFVGDLAYVSGSLGPLFLAMGGIPIASAREDEAVLAEAFVKIAKELKKGYAVGFHPEGFMTLTGYLQKIRPGVERIVAETHAPVVPVFIDGMYGSFLSRKYGRRLGKGDWSLRRRVVLRFGKPIDPEGFTKELLEETLVELGASRESDHGVDSRLKNRESRETAGE